MNFLRTLFWVVVTVLLVVFSLKNWTTVTITLFGGLQADAKLPLLLLIAFLVGFLPLYVYHRVTRWRSDKRAAALALVPPVVPASAPSPETAPPLSDAF
ncbi:hypothetical protein [Sphingomonas bacterium]|uniref:hypothetical protein n=1 Tax=Sphingomonas bacterium TaxID=1895847 RepID=UPI0015759920|nr:hypothetical protein [Sphingomonas bacterium]